MTEHAVPLPEPRTLPFDEARRLGLFLEANRRVFYPAGFALLSAADPAHPERFFARVTEAEFPLTSAADPAELLHKRLAYEAARLDADRTVEAIPGCSDALPVYLDDGDATVGLVMRLADALVEVEDEGLQDAVVLHFLVPLVRGLEVAPDGRLSARPTEPEAKGVPVWRLHRARACARWLVASLASPGGNPDLTPEEAREAQALAAQVEALSPEEPLDGLGSLLDRLEDLFAMGQAGMRFWRGRGDDISIPTVRDKIALHREQASEVERFLAGELAVSALTDRDGVQAAIAARAAPLRDSLAALDAERATLASAFAPLEEALRRLAPTTDADLLAAAFGAGEP